MDISLLVAPISGAVIGYITNLVAIKMLFRPYTEKKIGKFKIPFTPGLIPKERYHLSKVVGETISAHLLTDEVLVNALLTDEIRAKITTTLDTALNKMTEQDKTIGDYAVAIAGDNGQGLIASATAYGAQKVTELVDDALIERLASGLSAYFIGLMKRPLTSYPLDKLIDRGEGMLIEHGLEFFKSERVKTATVEFGERFLNKLSDDERTLAEYLPEDTVQQLEDYINKGGGQLAFDLVLRLMESESFNTVLQKLTDDVIDTSVNRLMAMFVSSRKVYERVSEGIREFCSNPDNIPIVANQASKLANKLLSYNMGTFINKVPPQMQADIISKFYELASLHIMTDSGVHYLMKPLRELLSKHGQDKNIYDLILSIEPEVEQKITGIISDTLKKYKEQYLSDTSEKLIAKFFAIKTSDLAAQIPSSKRAAVLAAVTSKIEVIIAKSLPKVVTAINLPKVIEERINAFELGQAEQIILSVVDKELKAITYFGGILGFLIGLMPLILKLMGL